MPETSVYEDDSAMPRKNDIGASWELAPMQSVSETCAVQQRSKNALRFRILGSDAGHHAAAHCFTDDVCHAGWFLAAKSALETFGDGLVLDLK